MKYGESSFDILYLLFAIVSGCAILFRAKDKAEKMMGFAALILGCGDAFHLVPRVLNYFVDSDFTVALGVGKLITSVTMTAFYLLMYYIWRGVYGESPSRGLTASVWVLSAIRIALCLFPQNGWMTNTAPLTWSILRNIPFVILGAVICVLYFQKRGEIKPLRPMWVYVLLSFLFYIPVAVGAGFVPMLGMLMLPKTVCYILMIVAFLRMTGRKADKA